MTPMSKDSKVPVSGEASVKMGRIPHDDAFCFHAGGHHMARIADRASIIRNIEQALDPDLMKDAADQLAKKECAVWKRSVDQAPLLQLFGQQA